MPTQDEEQEARKRAQQWAQNSADNDSRRWLAHVLRDIEPFFDVYAAACVLADLGPQGSDTTRRARVDAVRSLVNCVVADRERLADDAQWLAKIAAPRTLGQTVFESIHERRAAGESVESLARDSGVDERRIRLVAGETEGGR